MSNQARIACRGVQGITETGDGSTPAPADTGHPIRCRFPDLDREFGVEHPAEQIRACADAILTRYDDAPVRSMLQTIAYRETRECLRDDRRRDLVSTSS